MTENLTESFVHWPWAPWLLLAGVCFLVEAYRDDRWADIGLVGCLVASAVSLFIGRDYGWQFVAFAVGAVTTWGFGQFGGSAGKDDEPAPSPRRAA